ncbi:MAG: FGGY family carbohydrate kinase, partial [Clostridia bacterium]|nr:FGGY family carbohydrate kinase [Clostridia bacterium]
MEYLLSIDAGTTSFKGAIFDRDGNMIVSASCAYDLMTASGGIVEFSPEGYIKALKEILSQLFAESSVLPSEIIGLAIDSQGETLILIDKNGKPLR